MTTRLSRALKAKITYVTSTDKVLILTGELGSYVRLSPFDLEKVVEFAEAKGFSKPKDQGVNQSTLG